MKRSHNCLSTRELKELGSPDPKRKKCQPNGLQEVAEPSDSISKPIDIFGLNGDVLRKIFGFCSVTDLHAMAIANDQLKTLILDNGVRGRIWDFEELAQSCHILDVFKMFGKQMTNIKIGERDIQYKSRSLSKLDQIMTFISTYCCSNTLKFLDVQYFHGTSIKKQHMYAALPFFRGIESFTIKETEPGGSHECINYFDEHPAYNRAINDLVERIIANAENITAIEMSCLKITGRFFYAEHVRNLKALTLSGCNLRAPGGFISFLRNKPKLQSFKWDKSSLYGMDSDSTHSSNTVYKLVANNVPDLECFHYDQNLGYLNEHNRYVPGSFLLPNHEHIRKFKKLKDLRLLTMTIDCLKLLAEINQLEKLNVIFPSQTAADFDFLPNFSSLKSVKFVVHLSRKTEHLNFLSNLPQLTECHIVAARIFPDFEDVVVKAVESAKGLRILKISVSSGQLKVGLYSKLFEARLMHGFSAQPLILCLQMKSTKRLISRLGQAYQPDVIKIETLKF